MHIINGFYRMNDLFTLGTYSSEPRIHETFDFIAFYH